MLTSNKHSRLYSNVINKLYYYKEVYIVSCITNTYYGAEWKKNRSRALLKEDRRKCLFRIDLNILKLFLFTCKIVQETF
jgi:hypothetical protein